MSMDAKEVKVHVQQLEKAIKEALPPSHLLDLLGRLKKGVVPTEAMLRVCTTWRITMSVGALFHHLFLCCSDGLADNDVLDRKRKLAWQWESSAIT